MDGRRIVIANPHGFCAGVHRALESIEGALARCAHPVYCLNEIVHNRQVVDGLAARGVVFVRGIDEVPRGACVVFSAHGVSPDVRKAAAGRGLRVFDATCPFVQKLHMQVRKFASRGFEVLIVGHHAHDEIVGIRGEAPDRVTVIESPDEARSVEVADPGKVAVVTQTTLNVDEASRVMDVLRSRFPTLKTPSTAGICRATICRQDAVKRLVGEAKVVLVLGSENSSNTKRLVEVARACGAEAFLVNCVEALARIPLDKANSVGLTAGASTPEEFLAEVVGLLKKRGFDHVEQLPGAQDDVPLSPLKALRAKARR